MKVQVVANLEGEQVVLWVQEEVWRFDSVGFQREEWGSALKEPGSVREERYERFQSRSHHWEL